MKKLFSLVLALIFVFALAVPAFADTPNAQISYYNEDSDTWEIKDVELGSVANFIMSENEKGVDHCTVDLRGNTVKLDEEIYLSNGYFTLTIKNGTIDGQKKTRAIWINDYGTKLSMENLVIKNCKSDDGGAIYVNDDHCHIYGKAGNPGSVIFQENESTNCGGAIRTSYAADDLVIESITFKSNKAADDGGAILNNGYNTQIVNCYFEGNTTSDAGGAIYCWDKTDIISCEFDAANKSGCGYGHDIYCSASECKLTNNHFKSTDNNRVYNEGTNVGTTTGSFLSDGSLFEVILLAIIAIGVIAIYISSKKKNTAN